MDNREKISSEVELIILGINCLYHILGFCSSSKDYDSIMNISSIPEQKSINLENIKNLLKNSI